MTALAYTGEVSLFARTRRSAEFPVRRSARQLRKGSLL